MQQIWHHSRLTAEALIHQTGADPAYLTAVLNGTHFPGRRFTVRYARACGADQHILLKVWEDERQRHSHPQQEARPPPAVPGPAQPG
ncbi:helix-turn-helix domain-containing protein [Streptomyces sp. NPDC056716]|uniref:helix-turn-helix domain-containing protein n=1 Tax=unclassified Streptomyces TaxID=2593676 RepID=UPI0036863F28